MKIAVIADIHGNIFALEAVLEQIYGEGVDQIICAGDMINPFYESKDVWKLLQSEKIICLKGNHEDYLIDYYNNESYLKNYNYKPIVTIAKSLSKDIADKINKLPLTYEIEMESDNNLLICHASPTNNSRSYMDHFDADMKNQLESQSAKTIVNAHLHQSHQKRWKDKQLISVGSVGLPMSGSTEAEYSILNFYKWEWRVEHKSVEYNHQRAIDTIVESNFLHDAGSLSWLHLDELLTATKNFAHFIPKMMGRENRVETESEWRDEVISFLLAKGRWEVVKQYL